MNYFNMAKVKYYYDTKTLSYKRIELSTFDKIKRIGGWLVGGSSLGLVMVVVFFQFFDSPKEKKLKSEILHLTKNYEIIQEKMNHLDLVLDDIQERDDNIYRVIFEAEPIPSTIRKAGFGGVSRYEQLRGYNNSELIEEATRKIDQLTKQLYIQSKSFDEIIELVENKKTMLAAIPAIQPVSNKDLSRIASGYGMRIHPIYKTRKLHTGVDFSAPRGTPIYSTGDGKVTKVRKSRRGYGNYIVIDHGYGYETLYAHMQKYIVRKNQHVKRGEIIGYVGSSGTSVAPHLHYEVHKNNRKIDPKNFFYNDLNPEEYEKMLEISSQSNQSFD